MNTDELMTDPQTTKALIKSVIAFSRKMLHAELQQQATEDRVTSALDSLATWRERAERAEAENRKLRDAAINAAAEITAADAAEGE